MRLLAFVAVQLSCLTLCASAGADPVILPSPKAHPGGIARLEVVASAGASACVISFSGGGHYGPYRVSLGGPTRMIHWKVPSNASGS